MTEPRHKCAECRAREACLYVFNRFYAEKSGGGVGCSCPLPDDDAWIRAALTAKAIKERAAAMRAADALPFAKTAAQPSAQRERRYEQGELWRKYDVRHLGRVYTTVAKSEASAINCIRFKLYGTRPLAECAPFEATLAAGSRQCATMTKADAFARLRRMIS